MLALGDIGSSIYFFSGFAVVAGGAYAVPAYLLALAYFASNIALQIDIGSKYPVTGGAYTVVRDGLGHSAANIVASILLVGNLVMAAYGALGVADYLGNYLGLDLGHRLGVALLATLLAAAVAIRGVWFMGVSSAAFLALCIPVVVLIAPLALNGLDAGARAESSGSFVSGFAYAVKMFIGVEVLSQHAGELVNPRQSIIAAGAALFAGSAFTSTVLIFAALGAGELPPGAESSLVLLLAELSPTSSIAIPLSIASAVLVEFAAAVAGLSVFARTLYTLAVEGFAPSALASLHRRYRTPHVGILLGAVLAALLVLTGSKAVADMYGLASMVGYLTMAVALILASRRLGIVGGSGTWFLVPGIHVALAIPSIVMVSIGTPLALAVTVAMALASIIYTVIRRRLLVG